MKLTIITVVYNWENTIEKTINSVLSQSKNINLEYIIVDWMSSDKTPDIVKSYGIAIKYIREPDGGIYDAMNKWIKYSSGDIIGIINADDFYLPWVLDNVIRFFKKNNAVDIVHGNILNIVGNKEFISKPSSRIGSLYYWMTLRHPTCFVRRKIYTNFLFDQSFKIAADYDFLLKCYLKWFKFHYCDKTMVGFRRWWISDLHRIRSCLEQIAVRKKNWCKFIIPFGILLFIGQWKWLFFLIFRHISFFRK